MRPIKFRVWDKGEEMMLSDIDLNNTVDTWDTINEIFTNMTDELCFMQYTGFKDKNDIEIYEGDILSCSETAIVLGKRTAVKVNKVVVYSEKYAQYFLNKGKSNEHLTFVDFYDAEVVGNTYDNPELIDGVIND